MRAFCHTAAGGSLAGALRKESVDPRGNQRRRGITMAVAKAMRQGVQGMWNAQGGQQHHEEDGFTRAIESFTAEVPSTGYLAVAVAAMGASIGLMAMGKRNVANFIGLWVPSILIMGLYNKMVKQLGSDYQEN
jgi:hypothetical protein